eukprot:GFUD01038033.1.p1 GENE.GFUD01038033.1~~GFUD01038033.1.p1  ORF type:complete len:602 (-),score=120.13 GFUD01038033.1:163-1941(-)
MTVSYTHLSHTAGWVGGLTRLLLLWKGSLFKQIWPDFLVFFGLYFIISFIYRFILIEYEDSKVVYELFCVYCKKYCERIPITFLLGFYVTQVVSRWWSQFMSLPWPDTLARYIAVYMPGTDEQSRNYRRTVCRWVCLGNVLALRLVSYKVMVRFPTYEHLVESGLATNKEMIQLKQMDDLVNNRHQITWFPFMWAQNLLRKARKEGLIVNDWFTHVLIKEVDNMANMNGMLICYGWISIPLVYTQVVTLAVYTYFIACLFGRQYLLPTQYRAEGSTYVPVSSFPSASSWTGTKLAGTTNIIGYDDNMADFYVPVFTMLQYLFYMGWLKVAETLLNPWGEDDDDFDTYYLIDRNLQVAYIMSDEAGLSIEPENDPFGYSNAPDLKHTNLSATFLDDERPHMPTDGINLTDEQTNIATGVSSRRDSKMGTSIGTKLNLAGNILSTPVTELSQNVNNIKSKILGNGNAASFNMASHLLNSRDEARRPNLRCLVDIPDVIEEETTVTSVAGLERREQLPEEWWNEGSSPGISRNEQLLFSVTKVADSDNTSLKSIKSAESPSKKLTAGMMTAEENDDGDGDGDDCGDGDVFDAEGW